MTRQREEKKLLPAAAVFLLILALVCAGLFVAFTNHWVYHKYKNKLPVEISGRLFFTLPGEMEISSAVFRRGNTFALKFPLLRIEYHVADVLLRRKLTARLTAENAELSFQDFTKINQSTALTVQRAEIILQSGGREDVNIEKLFLESEEMIFSGQGQAGEKKLDLRMTCTLMPEMTSRIPDFILENIFSGEKNSRQQVEFRVQGSWESPFIAASSDLVQFEIKSKNAA